MDGDLLDIKQAATFLKVSEVSLRRWTNAGDLACLRVGGRRERRFRRQDLIDYLGRHESPGGRGEGSPSKNAGQAVTLEGMTLPSGSHLCTVYRTDAGRLKLSIPFLADGLEQGHHCFLIVSRALEPIFLKALANVRPRLSDEIAAGRLVVANGATTVDSVIHGLESLYVKALHGGATTIRLLGDMTWHRDHGLDDTALRQMEMRYEREIARRFPAVALCQYDARTFSGTGILDAIVAHPDNDNHPRSRFIG